ncbi:MAG: Spo0E family sporulation regulatory protein-aspartic acid phosphatase [Bacillota bacterium]
METTGTARKPTKRTDMLYDLFFNFVVNREMKISVQEIATSLYDSSLPGPALQEEVKDLLDRIECVRAELNEQTNKPGVNLTKKSVVMKSQELDLLLVRYYKMTLNLKSDQNQAI